MAMKDGFTINYMIPPPLNKYKFQHLLQLSNIWEMLVSFPSLSVGEFNTAFCISFDDYHKPYNKRHFGLNLFDYFLKLSLSAVETVPDVINNYTFITELEPKPQAGRLFSDSGTFFLRLQKEIKK